MATPLSSRSVSAPSAPEPGRRAPSGSALPRGARRILLIARIAIAAQFVWLAAFSTLEYQRGSLTLDFSIFNQARWLLTHGSINPYDSIQGFSYWQSHGEFLMWPLSQLTRIPPGGLWLLWLQAGAAAACGWVVLTWVAERLGAVSGSESQRFAVWALGLASVLTLVDLGTYQATAFDFHFQAIGALFALLAAREMFGPGRRRVWAWAFVVLATGDVAALLLAGVGLSGLIGLGRDRRRLPALIFAAGIGWVGVLAAIHANQSSPIAAGYGYLSGNAVVHHPPTASRIAMGALAHPARAVGELWSNAEDLWANLAPAGLIGIFSPMAVGAAALVLLPSMLFDGHLFAVPGFQNFPSYPFVVAGTAFVLMKLASRGGDPSGQRRSTCRSSFLARALCVVLGGLSIAWAAVWLPTYPSDWLRVGPSGSRALALARHMIPENAEVVASNGVAGRFSGRRHFYVLTGGPLRFSLLGTPVYFVLAPDQGIEPPVQDTESVLAQVAVSLKATLIERQGGVWVFRWNPPPGMRSLSLQGPQVLVPAWTLPSESSYLVLKGEPSTWRVASNSRGYALHSDYWFEKPGRYVATTQLSSTGPVSVEVWNANTNTLLERRQYPSISTPQYVSIPFVQAVPGSEKIFTGKGPLSISPVPPAPGQPVEIRVYGPGGSMVNVYQIGIRPQG